MIHIPDNLPNLEFLYKALEKLQKLRKKKDNLQNRIDIIRTLDLAKEQGEFETMRLLSPKQKQMLIDVIYSTKRYNTNTAIEIPLQYLASIALSEIPNIKDPIEHYYTLLINNFLEI